MTDGNGVSVWACAGLLSSMASKTIVIVLLLKLLQIRDIGFHSAIG
jgi:hypothetical protein